MKILIAGLVTNPQLDRLVEEGEKHGHIVEGCYSTDLTITAQKGSFMPTLRDKDIDSYDLIYLWAVSKRRWDWYVAALHLTSKNGTKIVNKKIIDPDYLYYLSPASEYRMQVENDLPFPKTALVLNAKGVDEVIDQFEFPLILKTAAGRQGKGVFKVDNVAELKEKISELKDISMSFVIRELIPNDGDIRIFTVGYKAIGAMKRTPTAEGEFRSNISVGGEGSSFDLDGNPRVREIAEQLSELTRTEIAGVDIMLHEDTGDPYILEINPGPQFTGFEKYTNVNAAEEIIKYFERL